MCNFLFLKSIGTDSDKLTVSPRPQTGFGLSSHDFEKEGMGDLNHWRAPDFCEGEQHYLFFYGSLKAMHFTVITYKTFI